VRVGRIGSARPLLRVAVSVALIVALLGWLDPQVLAMAFAAPHPGWLALALALGVPQVVLSAWRWRLTAGRLGVPLSLACAVREYYLATFLNQVLPGGILGDATRAWRHAREAGSTAAWAAVLIERLSGQLALALVAAAGVVASPALRALPGRLAAHTNLPTESGWVLAGALIALAGGAVLAVKRQRPLAVRSLAALHHALLARAVLARQLGASLLVVASYVAVFLCCLRMIGVDTPFSAVGTACSPRVAGDGDPALARRLGTSRRRRGARLARRWTGPGARGGGLGGLRRGRAAVLPAGRLDPAARSRSATVVRAAVGLSLTPLARVPGRTPCPPRNESCGRVGGSPRPA